MEVMAVSAAGRRQNSSWLCDWNLCVYHRNAEGELDSPWVGSHRFLKGTGRGQQASLSSFWCNTKLLWVTPLPKALASLVPSDPQTCPVCPNSRNWTKPKLQFLAKKRHFINSRGAKRFIPAVRKDILFPPNKLYFQGQPERVTITLLVQIGFLAQALLGIGVWSIWALLVEPSGEWHVQNYFVLNVFFFFF